VFENIYDQIVRLVEASIPQAGHEPQPNRSVIDESMGRLFDYFADHPNVPKLFVRRLLEADASTSEIERDILLPAWRRFGSWTYDFGRLRGDDIQAQIFMLTVNSVLLLFLLDSQQFVALLGGSVRDGELRGRLRAHVIRLVHALMNLK
jgi:hypothetical protein